MIAWIVASHDERVLSSVLGPSLAGLPDQDELILVRDAPSITVAYARGQAQAENPVRVYVHHDVRVLNLSRLRAALIEATMHDLIEVTTYLDPEPVYIPGRGRGIVGVIGSRRLHMPWWPEDDNGGTQLGSVSDTWWGRLDWGPGGECAVLDGVLLATRQHIEWDTAAPGWHGYDYDACAQMLSRGLTNWCLTGGHELVEHVREGKPNGAAANPGWGAAVRRFRERWG